VTAAAELNTSAYPSSIVLANSDGLVFGKVNNFDKLHIRSVGQKACLSIGDQLTLGSKIPLGFNNPLRVTHIPALRVFAVACRYITPARIGDLEDIKGSIQVFDDISFNSEPSPMLKEFFFDDDIELGHFNLEQGEEPTSLLSFTTNSGSYLCVAAVTLEDEDTEASKGRLFVLEMTPNALQVNMSVATSHDVKGCPYALTSVNSMIAAAVNSMVMG
jgi:DNA damage-binding protein 1